MWCSPLCNTSDISHLLRRSKPSLFTTFKKWPSSYQPPIRNAKHSPHVACCAWSFFRRLRLFSISLPSQGWLCLMSLLTGVPAQFPAVPTDTSWFMSLTRRYFDRRPVVVLTCNQNAYLPAMAFNLPLQKPSTVIFSRAKKQVVFSTSFRIAPGAGSGSSILFLYLTCRLTIIQHPSSYEADEIIMEDDILLPNNVMSWVIFV